jgi:hypothetical protein
MKRILQVGLNVDRGARWSNPRAASREWIAVVYDGPLRAGQRIAAFRRDLGEVATLGGRKGAVGRMERGNEWAKQKLLLLHIG